MSSWVVLVVSFISRAGNGTWTVTASVSPTAPLQANARKGLHVESGWDDLLPDLFAKHAPHLAAQGGAAVEVSQDFTGALSFYADYVNLWVGTDHNVLSSD
jgi:hypothetical protein